MIIKSIIYVIVYILIWLLANFLIFSPTDKYLRLKRGFGFFDENSGGKSIFIGWVYLLSLFVLVFYILSFCHYLPPFLAKNNSMLKGEAITRKADNLKKEAKRIRETLSDLEVLTIKQIQYELGNTLKFIEVLENEAIEQEQIISSLRKETIAEVEKLEKTKEMSDSIQQLTQPQLDAIKLVISENASNESRRSTRIGVMLSFPTGFITSCIANIIVRRRKEGGEIKAYKSR